MIKRSRSENFDKEEVIKKLNFDNHFLLEIINFNFLILNFLLEI